MSSKKSYGYLLGAIAAASYGLNPTFALPLYADGMNPDSVLLLRYGVVAGSASKGDTIARHLTRFRQMFPKLRRTNKQ